MTAPDPGLAAGTDEQRQAIIDDYRARAQAEAGGPADPAAAAQQAVNQAVDPSASGDAGASLGAMTGRGPLLPAEEMMNKLFEQLAAQAEQISGMQVQLSKATALATAARQIAGPPALVTYANGIAAKLQGHKAANPDLPAGHFDQVIEHALELAEHAKALADGDAGAANRLEGLASKIGRFVTRTHLRRTNKHSVDMSAVVAELEEVLDEADQLAHAGQAA